MNIMKKKRMVYTLLFCVWIGINYLNLFGHYAQEMADSFMLYREPPLYFSTFQMWFFNLLNIVVDSIFIAIATGIFAYHYRELKTWHYVVLALFVRYHLLVIILPFALWNNSLSELIAITSETTATYELAAVALIQLALAIFAAFVGMSYGRNADYLDDKDEELGYIGGVSKKTWAVLTLVFNPVARFSTKLSLVILYQFSNDVSSGEYWKATLSNLFATDENAPGGVITLLGRFLVVWLIWCATIFIFYFGIQTIRNKEANYRLLKILSIFVALPTAMLVIPIIRNQTWFF